MVRASTRPSRLAGKNSTTRSHPRTSCEDEEEETAANERLDPGTWAMTMNDCDTEASGTGSEDEKVPLISLRTRGSSADGGRHFPRRRGGPGQQEWTKRRPSSSYLEYEIQAGDTLRGLSIRFGCSITDLKRANNWFSDQDFFAQRTIKVPVKPHGILSEQLSSREEHHRIGIGIRKILDAESCTDSQEFLCKMDVDLASIRDKTKMYKDSLDEVVASLNSPQIGPLISALPAKTNGADCGISWWCLLAVLFLVSIVAPLCYLLYLKARPDGGNRTQT